MKWIFGRQIHIGKRLLWIVVLILGITYSVSAWGKFDQTGKPEIFARK